MCDVGRYKQEAEMFDNKIAKVATLNAALS